jgi:hypothetical protein
MTVQELQNVLSGYDVNREVKIAGHGITNIELVPAEGSDTSYVDIVGG